MTQIIVFCFLQIEKRLGICHTFLVAHRLGRLGLKQRRGLSALCFAHRVGQEKLRLAHASG